MLVEPATAAVQSIRDVLAEFRMGLDAARSEANTAASTTSSGCPAADAVLADLEDAAWERQAAEVKALER